jgi:DNA invertase Pin-like site-specific DNA recombinase
VTQPVELASQLIKNGVGLISLQSQVDTMNAQGGQVVTLFASLAEIAKIWVSAR